MSTSAPQHLSRDQFNHMHLFGCEICRDRWLEIYKEIPENRRVKKLDQLIYANHEDR